MMIYIEHRCLFASAIPVEQEPLAKASEEEWALHTESLNIQHRIKEGNQKKRRWASGSIDGVRGSNRPKDCVLARREIDRNLYLPSTTPLQHEPGLGPQPGHRGPAGP